MVKGLENLGFQAAGEKAVKNGKDTGGGKTTDGNVEEGEGIQRQQWDNPIEFLLSCIAMSVGLGNVWRFPFTAYENGGGAFLIPYLVVLLFIGRPLYFMELTLGQFSSSSSVKVWNMVPIARGIGFGQLIGTSSVVSYYCSLIAISLFYLGASCQAILPWTVCHPELEEEGKLCVDSTYNATESLLNSTEYLLDLFNTTGFQLPDNYSLDSMDYLNLPIVGSAEQYFMRGVLKEVPDVTHGVGVPDLRLTGCLAVCWVLLFLTLWKGVASSGKVAYITAIFPYVVLLTLLGKGLTLPGAFDGIMFYLTPKWSELGNLKVWYAAVTQSFFSLSTGFGAIITYSSYNKFNHNSYRDALIISVADTFTSLLAGFVIFSILGNLAHELGVEIKDVVKSGPGLAFVSYPTALAKFEVVPQLFSFLFFLMLVTLGLGSATGLTSGIIAIICDLKPAWSKTKITLAVCIAGFGVGLVYVTPGGQAILNLVDFFGGGFIIFLLAIVECVMVAWVYGTTRFFKDVKFMLGISMGYYWRFCLMIFIPFSLTAILIYFIVTYQPLTYQALEYPPAAIAAGWCLTGLAILQIPCWAIWEVYSNKGFRVTLRPNSKWGPAEKKIRAEWLLQDVEEKTSL